MNRPPNSTSSTLAAPDPASLDDAALLREIAALREELGMQPRGRPHRRTPNTTTAGLMAELAELRRLIAATRTESTR